MKFLLFLAAGTLSFLPSLVIAADPGGFVSCSGPDCNFCSLVTTTDRIISWLIIMSTILATLMLAYAGVKMVFSQGNPSALNQAKEYMINVFIGVLLMLAAWTVIDTLMKLMVGGNFGVWNEIQSCGGQFSAKDAQFNLDKLTSHDNNLSLDDTYEDGTLIQESGINGAPQVQVPVSASGLVDYAGAKFSSSIVDKIQYIDTNFDLRVSGGYRTPERNAAVGGVSTSYHLSGRAGDFVGSMSAMQSAQSWAKANGAKEALIHNAGSGTHLHVAW